VTGRPAVAVVGAGWAGASCARVLSDAGVGVEVFEAAPVVGGHSRVETLGGVVYEPNGAHIFHTSDPEVAGFVQRFGMRRPYTHCVLTEVFLDEDADEPVLLSWPPQIDELRALPIWRSIERELSQLPPTPTGENFEAHVSSLMGPTLFRLFIDGYTRKQWGREPSALSASIAPRRVELRSDGYRRLFRDRWEFFQSGGVNTVIERVLSSSAVTCNAELGIEDLPSIGDDFSAVVLTAPLDVFLGRPDLLEWRGITIRARLHQVDDSGATLTPAYVVNRPSLRVDYTRTVETKHASGQRVTATVVGEEFPSSRGRHYPVPTADGRFERINTDLQSEIAERSPLPVYFCGRLAEYVYINQDEAIRRGMNTAQRILADIARL